MNHITIIGVGLGNADTLTEEAKVAIANATKIYTFKRHAYLVDEIRYCQLESLQTAINQMEVDAQQNEKVAVLVSGDPGIYSLLPMLTKRFGQENIRVVAGISALQAMCASLAEPWQEARIVSGHGRKLTPQTVAYEVKTHTSTFLFCDANHHPAWVANVLVQAGLVHVQIAVGEQLGYPQQNITQGTPEKIKEMAFHPLSVVRVYNPKKEHDLQLVGLPDEMFTRGKVPMTKQSIRAQVVASLQLPKDAIVWDVGAGTGSVSVECALQCPYGQVYAIERKKDGVDLIQTNAEKFHLLNLEAVEGKASNVLQDLPSPTHVFLGGTGGELKDIIQQLITLGNPVRLVATAVTMESIASLLEITTDWEQVQCEQIAVTHIKKVGKYNMLQAENPIFILSANWKGVQ